MMTRKDSRLITYDYLTTHIIPGPRSASYFVPMILVPLALTIPRERLGRWQSASLFLPIIAASVLHAWSCMRAVDVMSVNTLLWSTFLLGLRDVQRDFRICSPPSPSAKSSKDGDGDRKVHEQPYPSADFWTRLSWGLNLLVNVQLVGWKIGIPSHDARQPPKPAFQSRKQFLAYSLLSFVSGYLIMDLTTAYMASDSYFTDTAVSIDSPLPSQHHYLLQALPPRLLRPFMHGAQVYALLAQICYLPAALPVLLNAAGLIPDASSPHTWPPYFGPWSSIFRHGLRGLWGEFWHQSMRWVAGGPGHALADAMGLRRHGGLARYAVLVVVTFGLSGVLHMGLVPPEPLFARDGVVRLNLLMAGFFWVQPVGILAETIVGRVVGSDAERWTRGWGLWVRMVVNGFWVVAWLALTVPIFLDGERQLGYWRVWPVPVSVWRGLRGEGWITWPFLAG